MILVSPFPSISTAITQAQAQQQTQQGKFFMILKIRNPQSSSFVNITQYEVYNITTSTKKLPGSEANNKKVEYSLEDNMAFISDTTIWWYIPYKIIDTSTPDVIKTKNDSFAITVSQFTKEVNTKTHVVTYSGGNVFYGNILLLPIPSKNLNQAIKYSTTIDRRTRKA